ncbi:MAG: ParB/RepB/Spo0J family partition protein [Bacilli bacterium]|nr:ParB/RepB/Spo0J family partition protein [Bacilli bacterium]
MNDNSSRVIEIDINEILPNRFQPRIKFDEEEILELSDSIKEHGVIQPIVVRPIGDKYEIIAGERRYKASVLAGKETVPVIVKNLNDKDSAEIALIENVQRKNLTPIEEALSYKKILDMGYITQENLAVKLGKSQPAVANKIRLLNLSDEVQEALLENKISERHARSLLKLSTSAQQNKMLNRIINERLTVRRADEEIEKMKNETSEEGNTDSQKIIEKGEMNMNNNMFGMPNVPQQPQSQPTTPSFDIFGMGNTQAAPVQPQVATPEPTAQPNFDIFANSVNSGVQSAPMDSQPAVSGFSSTPVVPEIIPPVEPVVSVEQPVVEPQPVMPAMPTMETISVPETPVMNFNFELPTASVQPLNSQPTLSEIPSTPAVPEVMPLEQSQVIEQQAPTVESVLSGYEEPQIPVMQPINETPEPIVPQTAPIQEPQPTDNMITQQSNNMFSFGFNNEPVNNVETLQALEPAQPANPQPTMPEFKMPEPIIVTDYSKQYDPVMPPSPENITPTVDFKEVINAIRECSSKIEQYGFKIDVEEYDLTNLYQVIFKIEK